MAYPCAQIPWVMLWLIHNVIWEQNVFLSHPLVSPQKCGIYICELPAAIWDTDPLMPILGHYLSLPTNYLLSILPPMGVYYLTAAPDLLTLCLGIDQIKLKFYGGREEGRTPTLHSGGLFAVYILQAFVKAPTPPWILFLQVLMEKRCRDMWYISKFEMKGKTDPLFFFSGIFS